MAKILPTLVHFPPSELIVFVPTGPCVPQLTDSVE